MITVRMHSDTIIDNPRAYASAVFGTYWTVFTSDWDNPKSMTVTVTNDCRRLVEVSRNIDVLSVESPQRDTWEDGSPCPLLSDEPVDSCWED